jgi:hypothetical protein
MGCAVYVFMSVCLCVHVQVMRVHGCVGMRIWCQHCMRIQPAFGLITVHTYNGAVQQLFIDFKKAYDSVKREVLYNILLEFSIHKKLVRIIKICLNEIYSKVHVCKLLSDKFPTQNGLKQGDDL